MLLLCLFTLPFFSQSTPDNSYDLSLSSDDIMLHTSMAENTTIIDVVLDDNNNRYVLYFINKKDNRTFEVEKINQDEISEWMLSVSDFAKNTYIPLDIQIEENKIYVHCLKSPSHKSTKADEYISFSISPQGDVE